MILTLYYTLTEKNNNFSQTDRRTEQSKLVLLNEIFI